MRVANISTTGKIFSMVTERTKIPFGKTHRGRRLKDCPDSYLKWVSVHLWESDFHEFALVAKSVLEERIESDSSVSALEHAADDFLRNHGVDPKTL